MCKSVVAQNTKRLIAKFGLKQKAVAERMNISDRRLSDILNGRKIIDDVIIQSLCNALDVEPNELFGYDKSA